MRAIFTRFDHFMTVFVAMFGVFWSTMFMPLLGGPLHTYEARAIGVGWQSLRTGEATSVREAMDIVAALPAEVLLPSAAASEMPLQVSDVRSETLELLGGPDVIFTATQRRMPAARVTPVLAVQAVELAPNVEPRCDAQKTGCLDANNSAAPLAAST